MRAALAGSEQLACAKAPQSVAASIKPNRYIRVRRSQGRLDTMPSVTHEPYFLALFLTLLVEGLVLWPWLLSHRPVGRTAVAFLGWNLLTHGLLWSSFSAIPFAYLPSVLVAEVLVVLTEAVFMRVLLLPSIRCTLALSMLANSASTLVGLALQPP
ncbi:MAG: hypothetical protein ACJAZO_000488 [Myxococcota bacterium]|jgi:hypothetical protein